MLCLPYAGFSYQSSQHTDVRSLAAQTISVLRYFLHSYHEQSTFSGKQKKKIIDKNYRENKTE